MRITPEFWDGKKVFVTGATGLLGGWVVRRLVGLGADVVALLRSGGPASTAAWDGYLSRVATIDGAVEDAELLLRIMSDFEVDTVLHLAAQPIVGTAKLDPVSTFRTNIEGTWNVLEAARRTNARQTIVASSDKVYGDSNDVPYFEDHPLQGRYPYDCSKSCADLLAQTYLLTYKMPVSIVRCANLFGGGDLHFNRLIPGVIRATLEGQPFVVRSDGSLARSYLYVEDAADAILHLAECVADGAPQGAYNFSLDRNHTVLQVVDRVLDIMGQSHLRPVILGQASDEIRERYMSCAKARDLLNWAPEYSFEAGLHETVGWYRANFPARPTVDERVGIYSHGERSLKAGGC
jgi:CDP-glucose 4,6-dehydratase